MVTNSRGQQCPATYLRTEPDVIDAEVIEDDVPDFDAETVAAMPTGTVVPTTESQARELRNLDAETVAAVSEISDRGKPPQSACRAGVGSPKRPGLEKSGPRRNPGQTALSKTIMTPDVDPRPSRPLMSSLIMCLNIHP